MVFSDSQTLIIPKDCPYANTKRKKETVMYLYITVSFFHQSFFF